MCYEKHANRRHVEKFHLSNIWTSSCHSSTLNDPVGYFTNSGCCLLRVSNHYTNHLTHLNPELLLELSILFWVHWFMHSPAGQLAAVLDWEKRPPLVCHGLLLCSEGRRLIKQMLVNKRVIDEMNLHLNMKR